MTTVYLDYNATAPLRPGVEEAVLAALRLGGNPSSVHRQGRAARRLLEDARTTVARLMGAAEEGVVFTSGGTEANNQAFRLAGDGPVAVSAIEHDSVLAAAPDALQLPVAHAGVVDLAAARDLIARHRPRLVSCMLVNNETGVIQPVAEVAALARAAGALVHVDAVQAAGRLDVTLALTGADLMTLSAHKIGGPPGVGALVCRAGLEPARLLAGGGQERRRRAGTENLAGIAGFGRAVAALEAVQPAERERIQAMRDALEDELLQAAPEARIIGRGAPRVGNTTCIVMPGVAVETQLIAFDLDGICVSSGAACSSGKVGPSHVLAAMGAGPEVAGQAIRVSLGHATQPAEIERFVAAWVRQYRRRRAAAPGQTLQSVPA